jgi:NADPH-dependent curcumin reductase CurA
LGAPVAEDFAMGEVAIPSPGEGEVLVRNLYLSLDPAIRGWMSEAKSYLPPIRIGDPIRSGTLSQVVASNRDDHVPGDIVQALAAWEEYSVLSAHGLHGKVSPTPGIPLCSQLSVLGGNGLTAYFGLLEVGAPRPGETVLVTAAAGGVGSLVGQIAKIHGCRAVGITGGADKARWLTDELGYDAAIDYKSEDLRAALKAACPKGVDVFFDSVGGEILNAGLARINIGARVVICGAISQINATELPPGPSNYMQLMAKRARMQGFMTLDYAHRFHEARAEIAGWIREGKLRYRDDIALGLENAPRHLLRLFDGTHRGKLMVKLADSEEVS